MRIGEQIVRDNKETTILGARLFSFCLFTVIYALLFTTCYLEGDLEALRPTGSGTPDDPYYVRSVETLLKVGSGRNGWDLNKYYRQTEKIDMVGVDWEPIGTESDPFTGNYNGQGYKISNLKINSPNDDQGLFGVIMGGTVENVYLANVDITGQDNTGSVAGRNYGTVTKCCSTGTVKGNDYVGGVVGKNDASEGKNGIIENCYSTSNVQGNKYIGGMTGGNGGDSGIAKVTCCYSTGEVKGAECAGGVVGENFAGCPVKYCVALGLSVSRISVNTNTSFGRIAGEGVSGLENNYARSSMLVHTETILVGDPNGIHGANVDAGDPDSGYHAITFWKNNMSWNFVYTWEMHPDTKLPILKDYPKVPEETQAPEMQYSFPLTDLETIFVYLDTRYSGNDAAHAVDLPIKIDLGDMTRSDNGWQELLTVIAEAGKYVNLDLYECDMLGTAPNIIFDPYADISTGKNKIVELTLPEKAGKIVAGSVSNGAFVYFSTLKSISGGIIDTISSHAFMNCTTLVNVSLSSASTIGDSAFAGCTSLVNVDFNDVTYISDSAFASCTSLENVKLKSVQTIEDKVFKGCTTLKNVTLGNVAPYVGSDIFAGNSSQTITVNVPSTATGYSPAPSPIGSASVSVSGTDTTQNWANGFRGGGWDTFTLSFINSSLINRNIRLEIKGNN